MSAVVDTIPNIAASLIDTLISGNRGDRHAFEYAGRTYSYQDVAALMNRSAGLIRGLGVAPGVHVLLLLPESPAFVASLLGGMKAGAVPVLVARGGANSVAACVEVTQPAGAIVHESRLAECEEGLRAIAHDAIVIVGTDSHGYTGFVDALRAQPSWLAPEPVAAGARALAVWDGAQLAAISHADAARHVEGHDEADAGTAGIRRVLAMLRTFAAGERVTLHA